MEKSGFFNDVDDDRTYYAEDWAKYLKKFFTNGIFNNSCQVLGNTNDMSVNVDIGSANIDGYRYDNDTILTLKIDNADGVLNRIDNIVLRLDLTNRQITAQVIKGSFADNPVAPSLIRTSTIFDLRLATIRVPAGTTTITQDLITDKRFNENDCGNVISAVKTLSTEDIFIQFETEFRNWFDKIKNQLDSDPAGKLSAQMIEVFERIGKLENKTNNMEATESGVILINGKEIVTTSFSTITNEINTVEERKE